MSVVCGTTAGADDLKILNRPVTFKLNRPIQILKLCRSLESMYVV